MRNNLGSAIIFPVVVLFVIIAVAVNCSVRPPDLRKPTDQRPVNPNNPKTSNGLQDKPLDRPIEDSGAVGLKSPGWGGAPDFTLEMFNGGNLTLSDHLGKVIILDFWATWCPPCRQEIPDFVQLQNDYGPRGLIVIGVSLDRDGANAVRPYADEVGINYPVVYGFNHSEVTDSYGGITSIPTTFIINQKGDVAERYIGYQPRTVFETKIRQLLGLSQEEKP